jgi:hypothetical protein
MLQDTDALISLVQVPHLTILSSIIRCLRTLKK